MSSIKRREETPRVKEIFDLYVVRGLAVTQIAQKLGTSHQAVSAVTNDEFFRELETHYFTALERELNVKQKSKLIEARALLMDHATAAAKCLILAAEDVDPKVRASAVTAQREILKTVGIGAEKEDPSSNNVLVINLDQGAVTELKNAGYDVPDTIEIANPTHAAHLGKEMGEALKEADERTNPDQSNSKADDSDDGGGVG